MQKVVPILTASALLVTGCALDSTSQSTPKSTSTVTVTPGQTEAQDSPTEEMAPEPEPEPELTEVDPARFERNSTYAIDFAGLPTQCFIKPEEDIFDCRIPGTEYAGSFDENVYAYDPAIGFFPLAAPGFQGFEKDGILEPGQAVTAADFTLAYHPDSTMTITRGAHSLTLRGDTFEAYAPASDFNAQPVTGPAREGDYCGDVTFLNDEPARVIALADGTDCTEGLKTMEEYMSPNPPGGPKVGSGAFYDATNGWHCGGGGYEVPASSGAVLDYQPSCGERQSPIGVAAIGVNLLQKPA